MPHNKKNDEVAAGISRLKKGTIKAYGPGSVVRKKKKKKSVQEGIEQLKRGTLKESGPGSVDQTGALKAVNKFFGKKKEDKK